MRQLLKQHIVLFIIVAYLFSTLIDSLMKQENDKIAVFGFHDVVSDSEKLSKYSNNMWVDSESSFREKIAYLYEQGYQTWTMEELYEWKCGKREKPERVVVLTFDDGYRSGKELVSPILEEYGFSASVFIIGNHAEKADENARFLSLNDLKVQSPMEYYSHTYKLHYRKKGRYAIDLLSKKELQDDFMRQQAIVDCSFTAYPYGHYNENIVAVLKENGVKMAFGYHENRKAERYGDFYTIPRFSVNAYTTMDTMKAMLESD